jgi:hypothetical protein
VPHDVCRELADVLKSDRNFFAALAYAQFFRAELNLIIAINGQGTLLAPCVVAEQNTAQREYPKGPSHCGFGS